MHHTLLRLLAGLALSLALVQAAEPAKSAKEKSPADVAADAFFKLRDDKDADVNGARLQQVLASGLNFLTTYPTHARVGSVINALANFGGTMRDKKLAALRDYWGSQLNYEIVNRRTKPDASDEVRLVLASLDAAYASYDVRAAGSREKLDAYRDKIDRLAGLEGSARFLAGHERDYIQTVYAFSTKLGEAQARKLMESSDKKLAAVGREELNLIELAKQPLELKMTQLDGSTFDAAALRGKVVYFVFWSSKSEASVKELEVLKDDYKEFKRVGVEIITVAHDTDPEALTKFVKAQGYAWPVLCDGQGAKGEFSDRLNVKNLPAGALFNQAGMFVSNAVRAKNLSAEVLKLMPQKKKK